MRTTQEDFLVLSGECLLLIEGEERRLKAWDFVHCPNWTEHIFVGAGNGPCLVLGVGARRKGRGIRYPVNALALKYGAGVEIETSDPKEAYARFGERQADRLSSRVSGLAEPGDELALAAAPAHLQGLGDAGEERDGSLVVAADRGQELRDPRCSRVGRELARQDRPEPSTLVGVGDRKRNLRGLPVTDQPSDADRLRVAAEVAHEHVVLGVDPREDPEVMRRQARLRATETALA